MSRRRPDDQALMTRIAQGDRRAFAALYDRHGALLFGVARRMLGSDEAQDVAQQTWVQAWREAGKHVPSRGSVAAWLLIRLRSRALDLLRRRAARQRAEGRAPAEASDAERESADPAARLERKQQYERVRGAMDALSKEERQVLEVAYFEGLTQREIAERFGIPLGSVKSWTRRGLMRLRRALAERSSS